MLSRAMLVADPDGLVDVVGDEHDRLAHPLLQVRAARPAAVLARSGRPRRTARPSAAPAGRRPAPGPRRPAVAGRRTALPDTGAAGRDRGRPGRPTRRPARRTFGPCPSRAAWARWRCSGRSCGAGTGRSAGSRSRCRGAARSATSSRMSTPSTVIVPAVGSISRLIIRSVVVLPQPDGPISTTISPRGTSRSRGRTAGVALPGNVLVTPRRRMAMSHQTTPRRVCWPTMGKP